MYKTFVDWVDCSDMLANFENGCMWAQFSKAITIATRISHD